ncbi:branched chain amino acid ABC transporter, partial [Fusobacterium nucleatum CC53]
SKVIERVGKILTPILLLLLFLIIVKGIFFSGLSIKPDIYPHAFKKGFLEGYQTMDTIASIAYAGIILKAIKNGRDLTQKQEFSFLIKAGLVAILSLALIYGGFALVGAKMHSVLVTNDKIELLVKTTSYLLGNYGNLVLAICVAGACLTTAIGLVATVGEFFSSITSFKYEKIVIFTVIISFLLSILGVESIIRISVPILVFIYPVMISLIILNLFGKYIKNDYVYKGVVLFTGIIGLIESLASIGITNTYTNSVLEILPFSDYGLTWLFPGLIGYILFSLMFRKVQRIENKV